MTIQFPPVNRIGIFDLASFFPSQNRFTLSMRLNNLLAAPGFKVWLQGEPLEIDRMFYTGEGKPRVSIFSVAHLNDAERMFFVSLLLNHVVGWMRSQQGTTSLRALLYMDEIYGYFPPVANPPSKDAGQEKSKPFHDRPGRPYSKREQGRRKGGRKCG